MLFLSGPRQVGKTTTAREVAKAASESAYLSWDNDGHRRLILGGPSAVAEEIGLDRLRQEPPLCVLDEVHKYARWKSFLKGLFDTYPEAVRLLVTGSARLDVWKAGGDSLMGRYFPYRLHPLSVAELVHPADRDEPVDPEPRPIDDDRLDALLRFGGFPEPFVRANARFWNRWRRLRTQQLLREELRDLTRIQELGQVEVLAELLRHRVGGQVTYSSLAREVNASVDSVRRWLRTLESLYYCFAVRPWFRNVARSLRKEPKIYMWDWSLVDDPGARVESFVASALLKATHFWTDHGHGDFALHYLRDKQKREVDFVVVRDGTPWFMVEVKSSASAPLSPSLRYFQEQTGAAHAFQLAMDMPFVERSCFDEHRPVIVPARTLLAQLV